jgi:hypothetical protein
MIVPQRPGCMIRATGGIAMETLETIHCALQHLSRWTVWVRGAAVLPTAFMMAGDVHAQRFAIMFIAGSDQISGDVLGAATT